jgi:hypothetical protein
MSDIELLELAADAFWLAVTLRFCVNIQERCVHVAIAKAEDKT